MLTLRSIEHESRPLARPGSYESPSARHARQLARRHPIELICATSGSPLPHHLTADTVRWLAPWDVRHYPGRQRVVIAALGRWVTPQTVNHWRSRCGILLPSWAARAWSAAIKLRCEAGLAIAAQLDAHADAMDARPPRPSNLPQLRAAGRTGIGARGKMRDPQT